MNNENKQQEKKETRNSAPQTKSFWGKRWTFPVIYLAASVLIVGLMYAKSQDAAPYEIEKQNTGEQAGPVLPSDKAATPANSVPSFVWPVGDGGEDAALSLDFFKDAGSVEENAMAVVSYESTFTPHEGVDIGLKSDAPFTVVAAAMGTVKAVKEDPLMGYTVEIEHGNGYSTYYASLSKVEVKAGTKVISGQPIAKSGNNRFEKEEKNHLHFELRKDGVAIDPNGTLPKKPSAYETSKKNGATTPNSGTAPAEKADEKKDAAKTEEPKDAQKTDADTKPAGEKQDASKSDADKAAE
ncbi:stage II sporulation protein Q [Tumebacillus sp. BK434]|uniref:M23 family metallopeptidase n=1 Tax=Tumebacillus sp. BK434 TaxID=2512169 RepID=UPI0010F08346|nr:M23 family metallopeptidase [Tumebacillus sp. BK434]TCP57758.1 stage II sporulation protein Q [Tumebacillus sp. BK434]